MTPSPTDRNPRLPRSLATMAADDFAPAVCATTGCEAPPACGVFCARCAELATEFDLLEIRATAVATRCADPSAFSRMPGRIHAGVAGISASTAPAGGEDGGDEEEDEPTAAIHAGAMMDSAVLGGIFVGAVLCVPVDWVLVYAAGVGTGWLVTRLVTRPVTRPAARTVQTCAAAPGNVEAAR